jgi:hypothetical protein
MLRAPWGTLLVVVAQMPPKLSMYSPTSAAFPWMRGSLRCYSWPSRSHLEDPSWPLLDVSLIPLSNLG